MARRPSEEISRLADSYWRKVRFRIDQKGILQKDIAASIGMDATNLSTHLRERKRVSMIPEAVGLARVLNVSLDWLLDPEAPVDQPVERGGGRPVRLGEERSDFQEKVLTIAEALGPQLALDRLLGK